MKLWHEAKLEETIIRHFAFTSQMDETWYNGAKIAPLHHFTQIVFSLVSLIWQISWGYTLFYCVGYTNSRPFVLEV